MFCVRPRLLLLAMSLFIATPGQRLCAADAVATKLDGTTLTGELHGWSGNELTLTSSDGEQRLPAAELLSLRWSPDPTGPAKEKAIIELTDGTLLPIANYSTKRDVATIEIAGNLPTDQKSPTLPVRSVKAVRLRSLEGELAAQWDEVRSTEFVSDVLVVLKREGKSLDYVEGVVGDVSADKVAFELDDQAIEVDRAKVAGILYYRDEGQQSAAKTGACVLAGRGGLRAHARDVALADGMLKFSSQSGLKLTWPLDDIYLADFSAGKLKFLSDIDAAAEKWTPLIGLPSSLKLASEYGQVRRDESAYGGKLMLRYLGKEGSSTKPRDESFDKGLAIRSRTELAYRLPAGFGRFLAVAGIEPTTSASGDVFLTIDGDGRRLLETQVAGDQPPQEIELDIRGVKRLTIVVDYGQNLDTGDWLNLCNARLVK